MRILFICLAILFSLPCFAQRKKRKPRSDRADKHTLHILGGVQFDNGQFAEDSKLLNHFGFSLVNIGISRYNYDKKAIQSFELEGSTFKEEFVISRTSQFPPFNTLITTGFDRMRQSLELVFNHAFILNNSKNIQIYAGPTGSLVYNRFILDPKISNSFPLTDICICAGIGGKAGLDWSINDKIYLSLSTRLTLLDIGYNRQRVDNPILPIKDRFFNSGFTARLLRKQFPIMFGLKFNL